MAEEGQVISCHSVDHWNEHFNRGKELKKLDLKKPHSVVCYMETSGSRDWTVVVDFTALWCAPCRFIAPILAEYAKKFPHVIFLKVDVDELEEVAKKWNVDAMPTFVFLKDGEEVERVVGARKEELLAAITKHAAEAVVTA